MNNAAFDQYRQGFSVADALPSERATFIKKTYMHLAAAIVLFTLLLGGAINSEVVTSNTAYILSTYQYSWLVVLAAFMGVSWLAQTWAQSTTSKGMQYGGLLLYVFAQSIIFVPLMMVVSVYSPEGFYVTVAKAGIVTLGLFLGLTAVVFVTGKDFSFLGPILAIGGFVALGFIASGVIFGFSLGNIFAFAMVAFAGGAILYETSNMMHHYRTDQYVAASLGLFASVALLFWYLLSIFSSRD